jgi:hypothetical protein
MKHASMVTNTILAAAEMKPEEDGNEVREIVREMSRTTNRILILGVVLVLAILVVLKYGG